MIPTEFGGSGVPRNVRGAVTLLAALLIGSMETSAVGEDELSIVGTYAKDQVCKGDGSDPSDLLVRITRKAIESSMGSCTILGTKRNGKSTLLQVECKMPGNLVLLSDVTF